MTEPKYFQDIHWFIVDGQYPIVKQESLGYFVLNGSKPVQIKASEVPDVSRRVECSMKDALALLPPMLRSGLRPPNWSIEIGNWIASTLDERVASGTHPDDEREASRAKDVTLRAPVRTGSALPRQNGPGETVSPRLALAAWWAARLHATQMRKGTSIPYVSHLFGVSALVLEFGGDEEQAIAGLLHDAIEDQGGAPVREMIREVFGECVLGLVEACTDTDVDPKPPWEERKRAHIKHLRDADRRALLVAAADKLHNARSTLADLRREGLAVYSRFNAPRGADDTLWYYKEMVKVFVQRGVGEIADSLSAVVNEMELVTHSLRKR